MSTIDDKYDHEHTDNRLGRAGWIALRYGLRITDVADLLATLESVDDSPLDHNEAQAALKLLATLREARDALLKVYKTVQDRPLRMAMVSSVLEFDRVECLQSAHTVLDRLLYADGLICDRETLADPRASILQCRIGTAGQWWFDFTGEWPLGKFVSTAEGLEPEPEPAVEFIVESLDAAGCDYTNEEIAGALEEMRRSIGMYRMLREAEDYPDCFEDWMTDFGVPKPQKVKLTLVT